MFSSCSEISTSFLQRKQHDFLKMYFFQITNCCAPVAIRCMRPNCSVAPRVPKLPCNAGNVGLKTMLTRLIAIYLLVYTSKVPLPMVSSLCTLMGIC